MDERYRRPKWGPGDWELFERAFEEYRRQFGTRTDPPRQIEQDVLTPKTVKAVPEHEGVLLGTRTPLPGTNGPNPELWDITPGHGKERISDTGA